MGKVKPWTAKQTRIAMLRFAEHYRPLAETPDHYILGIDPSMSGTAVAVDGGFGSFDWKSISTSGQVSQAAKLVKIRHEVSEFSKIYAGKYLMVVCEDVNVMSHMTGVVAVASAKAVSLEAVASAFEGSSVRETPYFLPVVNRTIKKALSGDGKAEKIDQIRAAEALVGKDLGGDDDSADAIGATQCGVFFLRLIREILNLDLTGLSIDEQANRLRLLLKSLKSKYPAHEVEVAEGMLKSKKIFKENFGKYAYDKIRKEIKEV